VGPKGQVVIEKRIRDRLGIAPGWVALQRLVDDYLEIHFVPPEHSRSLKGILGEFSGKSVSSDELAKGREEAWRESGRASITTDRQV
jgi:hypothetical protein